MKITTKKKFISLLVIVLVFSMFSPAVFAAKKTTTAYTLKSITGGGLIDNPAAGSGDYSFGLNIRKTKVTGSDWAVNLVFNDPKTAAAEDDVKIKINAKKVAGSAFTFTPTLTPPLAAKPDTQTCSFTAPGTVRIGNTGPFKATISVTLKSEAKGVKDLLSISVTPVAGGFDPFNYGSAAAPLTLSEGNIIAHFIKSKS